VQIDSSINSCGGILILNIPKRYQKVLSYERLKINRFTKLRSEHADDQLKFLRRYIKSNTRDIKKF